MIISTTGFDVRFWKMEVFFLDVTSHSLVSLQSLSIFTARASSYCYRLLVNLNMREDFVKIGNLNKKCFMIYLLTANGLTQGGSSTVHIYTQTIHRITQ